MIYRREIDGLRAVAVIPVILFHAGFRAFPGGFVGVDVFFVISGYLITTILADDLANNRFSLLGFYERRARRILPALFLVMLVCIPFAWLWMLPVQFRDFSQSLLAVSVFASNILFWQESGYFAEAAELKPLLHTWSLAVEEQFYLFFPVLLLLVWRLGRSRVFWMIVAISLVSLLLAEWGWRNKPIANFYLAPARIWELFAGSIAAFVINRRGVRNSNAFSLLGLAAILFAIFAFNQRTPFPSVYALVPVLGTYLLIVYGGGKTIVGTFLSNKVLVGMGLISYSAYLWHQPLFAFARIRLLDQPSVQVMLLLSASSFILAMASWRFVEQPFRRRTGMLKGGRKVLLAGLAGILIFSYFETVWRLGFDPSRFVDSDRLERIADHIVAAAQRNPYRDVCHLSEDRNSQLTSHPLEGCTDFFIDEKAKVMLVGDSHAEAIGYQAQLLLHKNGISSYAVSYGGCISIPGFYRTDVTSRHLCDEYTNAMLDYARKDGISTIVIVSRAPVYLHGHRYDNGEGGVEKSTPAPVNVTSNRGQNEDIDSELRKADVLAHLKEQLIKLTQEFKVVLVYPIPAAGWHVPTYFAKKMIREADASPHITTSHERYLERTKEVREVFDSLESENVFRARPSSLLCNVDTPGRCNATTPEGQSLYYDDNHLSSLGARLVAPLVLQAVQGALGDGRP